MTDSWRDDRNAMTEVLDRVADDPAVRVRVHAGSSAETSAGSSAEFPAPPDPLDIRGEGVMPTAREVIVAAMTGATHDLLVNLPDVMLDAGPEHVHKSRVAARRLRSDLGTFAPLLEPGWADELRNELRWLGGTLGTVRDLDVLSATLTDVVDEHPVIADRDARAALTWFSDQRAARHRAAVISLGSPRATHVLGRLVEMSRNPHTAPQGDDPADELLPPLARRPWRRLERAVGRLSKESTDEDLHRIRILAKRARYAAEAVEPACGRPARRFAKAMTDIQECLGELNDAIVIGVHLRDAAAAEPAIAYPAGQLASLLGVRAEGTRKRFRKVWRRSSDPSLRRWW